MHQCQACVRSVVRSALRLRRHDVVLISLLLAPPTSTRPHSTIASIQKSHHLRELRRAARTPNTLEWVKTSTKRTWSTPDLRDARARSANRHHLDLQPQPDRSTLGPQLSSITSNRALQIELKWTGGDALKLAKAVLDKLRACDPHTALELIRLSEKLPGISQGEKSVDSVVSWNHVIDYYMTKGFLPQAFKVFNEMKKRGHRPDAHTYTIMLRGYSMRQPHPSPKAIEDAMKVYDSLWAPESRIKPNIIHSNAIINCLARAGNMDGIWSIAGRLPERGPGSPDKWTYTTILHAMRSCLVRDAANLVQTDGDQDAAAKLVQKIIGDGRRMWEDVVSRWRAGEISIDETLVCAMGRLLLLGEKRDLDDVFSLVEQTMRLARPPASSSPPQTGEENRSNQVESLPAPTAPDGDDVTGFGRLELAVAAQAVESHEFAVVDLSDRPVGRREDGSDVGSPYARVGNNVLSLLMETAIKLKAIPAGKMYWKKLTDPEQELSLRPDSDNLHTYLRLLRCRAPAGKCVRYSESPSRPAWTISGTNDRHSFSPCRRVRGISRIPNPSPTRPPYSI